MAKKTTKKTEAAEAAEEAAPVATPEVVAPAPKVKLNGHERYLLQQAKRGQKS